MEETKEQLQDRLYLEQRIQKERDTSDGRYAIKLVEKVVFGLVSLLAIGVITALLRLILK